MSKRNILTRREFLQKGMILAAASFTIPSFLLRTAHAIDNPNDVRQTASIPGMPDGRILVVIQMGGGNDGINTVVPYGVDDYYRLRKALAIGKDEALKINDTVGLHPGLAKLKGLYDDGRVAVVQGVGYPNPNRSHFRSTEIWETASDADKTEKYGWIGRYFDNTCPGCGIEHPEVAVNVGRIPPQAFHSMQPMGIAVDDPNSLEWKPPTHDAMAAKDDTKAFRDLNEFPAPASPLDFVQRTSLNAQLASDKMRDAVSKYKGGVDYPKSQFAHRMQLIAQLIAGGLSTRVYYASLGSFDTHARQKETHANLLTEFAEAVDAFTKDLKAQGNDGRVVIMTFSEFGRRAAENASEGTDHGTAAPMFVIGSPIKGGLYAQYPSLTDLDHGDLRMAVDFRSVYATILENWLGARARPILNRDFSKMSFVA